MRYALLILLVLIPFCSFAEDVSKDFEIQSISLSYISSKTLLHVSAKQHSSNHEQYYVNKMTVSLNGSEVMGIHLKNQTDPDEFSDYVILKAKQGDVISVELFSNEGTTKSLDLTVTDEDISETKSVDENYSESIGIK